jgi:hypothetical protein
MIIEAPDNFETNETSWWVIFDPVTKVTVMPEPIQCAGFTSSPFTMVVHDTREEVEAYLTENQISYPEPEVSVETTE